MTNASAMPLCMYTLPYRIVDTKVKGVAITKLVILGEKGQTNHPAMTLETDGESGGPQSDVLLGL